MRDTTAGNNEEQSRETAESPAFPAYFLITDDCTVAVRAADTDHTVSLHTGDVVCLTENGVEINGDVPMPDGKKNHNIEQSALVLADGEADRILQNGTTIEEAFYKKAVKNKAHKASVLETAAPAADKNAETTDNTAISDDKTDNASVDENEGASDKETASEDTVDAAEVVEAAETDSEKTAESNTEKPKESYSVKQLLDDALDLVESVLTSVFVVMLLFTFVFCVATVDGDSMVPTLTSGDRLMVSRFGHSYDTGDILILDSQSAYVQNLATGEFYTADGLDKRIVKRLIGQAGDVVNIDFSQGIVYVNGEALSEPYTNTLTTRDNGAFTYPLTVPEGYVFVLGDNRNISKDSRHPQVGLVPVEDIVGKVVLRLTPFSAFGTVD